ncbi:hypothetical protein [Sphingomonas sp. NIC1]|uniref:hypothetical protein n=1 Tax=Sphingomonas sp. NIC1 TaxID=1961362 RepID=UPI000AA94772|nr:hypothetical protein [Sphingomonas sp. NIC1]
MTLEQLAARLAGGFITGIDPEALRDAIQASVTDSDLGELDNIKALPGFVSAAADTLHKAWRAGVDLSARAGEDPRLAAIAALEDAVIGRLPTRCCGPAISSRVQPSASLMPLPCSGASTSSVTPNSRPAGANCCSCWPTR